MKPCGACNSYLIKANLKFQIDLASSSTKINGELHMPFDRKTDCIALTNYSPDVIILAGNGAIEVEDGLNCWDILKNTMNEIGITGPDGYKEPEEGLTWLAANIDFMGRTVNFNEADDPLLQLKKQIVGILQNYETKPRAMYCTCCNKHFKIQDSASILILTTNWDLGLFLNFRNVIQLHGRCDYPKQAILPLQNLSRLMAKETSDLKALNAGFIPGPFLQRCLNRTQKLIFWGTGLNDYDAALWHFLRGFASEKNARNTDLEIGIASKDTEGFINMSKRIGKYFPRISINNCVCKMVPH